MRLTDNTQLPRIPAALKHGFESKLCDVRALAYVSVVGVVASIARCVDFRGSGLRR